MSLANELLKELKQEAAVTRRYLENVPFDKLDYKPAAKSETLGRLAIHLAEIVAWWTECINKSELDFIDFEPQDIRSGEELLSFFDCLLSEAERALSTATNSDLEEPWSMMHGETVYFTLPKKQVLRVFCMNHLVHHRAQLGVYLRILDIALPATYGPSADDENVILASSF